ncbi:hypothetical protein [Bosea minatitlanensis]|uniref:Uncharacterized protein n=1 Tax=Bosea minatitlanensis TaxID=128782 RepID=A0ABW0F5B5_9HYPH|nr:hypothetical protein [Bosea minatitlanensis]MCT4496001.1 hypothetical protein [Bosea minatitlanensis]
MTALDPGLLLKMAIAAAVVVTCSLIAERSGPKIAAMIATLPISLGPVLFFLSLEHEPAFLAESARGTMNANVANAGFVLAYVFAAQRFATLPSLAAALAAWVVALLATRGFGLPAWALTGLAVAAFAAVHRAARPYLAARPVAPPRRAWFAIPLRAACVAGLVGGVTLASHQVGANWSGVLAGVPLVLSSLVLILQPRIGGPATAALIGNGALGLLGVGLGLAALYAAAVPLGSGFALLIGLTVSVAWNAGLLGLARRPAP